MENRFSKHKNLLRLTRKKSRLVIAKRFISLLILCLMLASTATSFIGPAISSGDSREPICKFDGPDTNWYIEITDYVVYGPSNPRVGDDLVVFFTIKYVGKSGQAVLDRVYVKAILPDGSTREYEDRSFRGKTLGPGESVRFHTEIEVSMKGTWHLWPSIEYHVSGSAYSSPERWHECTIIVSEKETTTTTTPEPLPDLSFNPQYLQPLGYSRCGGFYAHIKNTGRTRVTVNTTALFRIRYGNNIIEDRMVTIPALDVGEEATIYSGPFIGVPGREYRVTVILDYGNIVSEISESNIRSLTITYSNNSLPVLDLEVKNLEYTGSSINFTVKHSGCIDSPQAIAHLGVRSPPTNEIIELDNITVPSLSGLDEVELSFNDLSSYITSNPELSGYTDFEIHVWINVVEITYQVMGQQVVIRESNELNNERTLHITTALIIEGPNTYFLKRRTGYSDYLIRNPRDLWRAVGGVPGKNITYEYEVEGCNAWIRSSSPTSLIITVPERCTERGLTLRVKASSGGIVAEKDVELLFYDIGEPRPKSYYLYSDCLSNDELNANSGFVFAGSPIEIWFSPIELLLPVIHTHATGQRVTYEEPEISVVVKWQVNGFNRTYIVPSENISVDWSRYYIVFTIPNDVVFNEVHDKAVQVTISLIIVSGSNQRIRYDYDYWLHEEPVLQVYLRSFNFPNTPCTSVSWSMWEDFWGVTAVNECLNRDYCAWKDPASYLIYEQVFKEMCDVGRCFSYALSSQKFYEDDVYACGYCGSSTPQPFAVRDMEIVCTNDICEAGGEPHCPSKMALTTYLTYEYMWALDERNVLRGLDKFDRYRAGEDIVLETLNELREWESLPPEEKWSNPYIIMMIPPNYDEIRNAHAVLAYRVEEINETYVRVWVVDSNRPFQPNNSTNQDRSHIDFYCCGSDGRWNFEFRFNDGRVLSDFLYASPTDLFEGDSHAITSLDFLLGVAKHLMLFLELLSNLGAAPESSNNNITTPSLYMVYSDTSLDYIQVEDHMGRRIFDPATGGFEEDPYKMSAKIVPLLLPAPVYVFVGDGGEWARITLQLREEGRTIVLSEDAERSIKVEYRGGGGQLNEFSINPRVLEVSGTSLKGFMVTSHSISGEYPYEIIVGTRPGQLSFRIVFEDNGSLEIVNLGEETLVFDLRMNRYDFDKREPVGETYDGLEAKPGSTLIIAPESWENIVGSKIIVGVDEDSNGVVDYEEAVEPRSIRPVAVASDIYAYANESGYAKIVLDGSASYSPTNKPLTWTWRGDFIEGREVRGEKVTVTMTTGTWIVELVVSDGELESIPKEIKVHVLPEELKPGNETTTPTQTPSQTPSTSTTTESTIQQSSRVRGFLEDILRVVEEKTMLLVVGALIILVLVIIAYILRSRK